MTDILINLIVSGASAIVFVAPPYEDFDTLVSEYRKALREFDVEIEAHQKARAKSGKNLELPVHPSMTFLPRFRMHVIAHRSDPQAAIRGLSAILEIANSFQIHRADGTDYNPVATWAVSTLAVEYAACADVMEAAPLAIGVPVPQADVVRLFDTIAQKNQDRETVATAKLLLSEVLGRRRPHGRPPEDKRRSEAILRELAGSYADTEAGEEAKRHLFEIEHLQVGMLAPDFKGKDVDGKTIRLSKFRGNVVVIVFWGPFWNSEGRSFPAERELVGKFGGRPFVLLGVNNHAHTRSQLRRTLEKEAITWPNILDVGGEPNSIARQWNVRGWPSNYVLDHTGVIRGRNVHGKQLDAMVEELTAAVPP